MLKGILIGIILTLAAIAAGIYIYFSTGMAPVATSDAMMPFEKKLAGMALRARIAKEQIGESPVAADDLAFVAGAKIYKDHCAACHGLPNQPPVNYASTMFPKPPQLFRGKGVTDDPASESYWKVANGIRLSGMPSFKTTLTDTQIWQVSQLVAHADKLPEPAKQLLAADASAASASPSSAK